MPQLDSRAVFFSCLSLAAFFWNATPSQEWMSFSKNWSNTINPEETNKVFRNIISHSACIREIYAMVRTEHPYNPRDAVKDDLAEIEDAFDKRASAHKKRKDAGIPDLTDGDKSALETEQNDAAELASVETMGTYPAWLLPIIWYKPTRPVVVSITTLDPLQIAEEEADRHYDEVMDKHKEWLRKKLWTKKGAATYYNNETARSRFLTVSRG